MVRRLAAVLAADVVGYSRLMEIDEVGTLAALKAHREALVEPAIGNHDGRVVKRMGDGLLAEFASVVDAVTCAVAIQEGMAERNAGVPARNRIELRIGVHLGDVIVDDDDIYGDGVNVAARLEGLADPAGICLSQQAYDQVETKLILPVQDLGPQRVKNIARPVRAYRVLRGDAALRPARVAWRPPSATRLVAAAAIIVLIAVGAAVAWWQPWKRDKAPASDATAAVAPSEKPSVAVLPFQVLGDDPQQEYFADGLTEDLTTDLAKFPVLEVTARTTMAAYKGRSVDVRQLSRELGVRYLVEGSIEKSAERIRVTAQLIDATTGNHLWAERFDRELVDVFAIRDNVIAAIVGALTGHTGPLVKAEERRAMAKSADKLQARDFYYQAMSNFASFNKEANARARSLLERSIELDPTSVETRIMLAWVHWRDGWIGWREDEAEAYARALEVARKTVALDPSNYRAHWVLGAALRARGDAESARAEYDRAFQLNPRDPDMLADWGEFLLYGGEPAAAVAKLEEAVSLNPHYPDWYLNVLSHAYYHAKRYEEAVRMGGRVTNPQGGVLATMAASYGQLGRAKEAAEVIGSLREFDAFRSISRVRQGYATMDVKLAQHMIDGLRKAGLPE